MTESQDYVTGLLPVLLEGASSRPYTKPLGKMVPPLIRLSGSFLQSQIMENTAAFQNVGEAERKALSHHVKVCLPGGTQVIRMRTLRVNIVSWFSFLPWT